MKKILIINNGFPSKRNPKNAAYIKSIKGCLEDGGFIVTILHLDVDLAYKSKVLGYVQFYLKLLFFRKYEAFDWIYLHHYTFYAPFVFVFFDKMNNIAVHWHGQEIYTKSRFIKVVKDWFYKKLDNREDILHIVPSNFYAEELKEIINFQKHPKLVVSPSGGVNISLFDEKNLAQKDKQKINIGFASGITYMKGIDFIIKLCSLFPDFENKYNISLGFNCIFYGKDKLVYKSELEKCCGDRLVWWKAMAHVDMPTFYNSNDVLIFPTRADSLGLVALEAMSCGTPVVGPNAFALKEFILEGVTGECYDKDNIHDKEIENFTRAFERCLSNLGKYNPRQFVVEKYSQKAVSEEYKRLFKG